MKKAIHNRSNEKLATFNCGELVPIGIFEALPGEVFRHHTNAMLRTQALLAPVMHKVDATVHHWFVPSRLIWDDWEDFITGGPDGENASVFPTITFGGGSGAAVGSLADYFGVPTGVNNIQVSALPFRAYALIWNCFYRDKDLQTELVIDMSDGADTTTSTALQNGAWEKDYFTTCRSEPQRGPEAILPLTGNAPIVSTGQTLQMRAATGTMKDIQFRGGSNFVGYQGTQEGADTDANFGADGTTVPGLEADLTNVAAVSINQLRLTSALQRFAERSMRFGQSYAEYLRAAFHVRPADARIQWPEYLGGGRQAVQFSEVVQTAEGSDPVGELRGHGINVTRSNRYKFFVPEHGYIISLMCVRPKTVYAQGLPKLWNRRTRYDFFDVMFQNLGQQEVLNKELYAAAASPDGVFGYQDRWDEYRRVENTIAGEFRSTLNFWHMARIFGSEPALNAAFVSSNPTNRIYATDADQLQVRIMHNCKVRSPVAKISKPMLY